MLEPVAGSMVLALSKLCGRMFSITSLSFLSQMSVEGKGRRAGGKPVSMLLMLLIRRFLVPSALSASFGSAFERAVRCEYVSATHSL